MKENASAWTPLRQPLFRDLWTASVVSNLGTWMQNIGGVWLMTSLSTSPFLIALMQAASSLPFFLVSLVAGALADILDRRRLLIVTQIWMTAAAVLLGIFTVLGLTTPWLLLWLTFALGLGGAMNAPAWQAVIPEVAGKDELPKAVALNGVGYNIARVIGPTLGGIVVATMGISANFFLNGLSFLGVIVVILRWKRAKARESTLPTERLVGAMRAGIRYALHAPELQAVLFRSGIFVFFGSAVWALLPVVAKQMLGLGSSGYGLLVGCLGAGSLVAAFTLPRLSRAMSLDARLSWAGMVFGLSTVSLAVFHNLYVLCFMMVLAGYGWLVSMVAFNVGTQSVAPGWVQARAIAFYVLVTQGALAIGAFVWGAVASHFSTEVSLVVAGLGLITGLAGVKVWPLSTIKEMDTTPVVDDWTPMTSDIDPEDGPVMVTVEYRIDPAMAIEFREAMGSLRSIRRRDGAIRWELYADIERPGRFFESFVVESWAEHLRQHKRHIQADIKTKRLVRAFHLAEHPPIVSHLIYCRT